MENAFRIFYTRTKMGGKKETREVSMLEGSGPVTGQLFGLKFSYPAMKFLHLTEIKKERLWTIYPPLPHLPF
jgi:hypothetical protein